MSRPALPPERLGWRLRLQSLHHAYWFWLSNTLKWRRGNYRERPVGELRDLTADQQQRIRTLKAHYQVAFEQRFDRVNALENYTYLDLLDQFRQGSAAHWPSGLETLDVGSKNFYYAAVLHAAFRPARLTGLELEGYRLYPNFYSRHDYAQAYIRDLPNTDFQVGDVRSHDTRADLITCFYPFVFADVHVAWYLPLHLFDPAGYFRNLARLLRDDGCLIMVNQGQEEFEAAAAFCVQNGLRRIEHLEIARPLTARRLPPQVSMWTRTQQQQQGGST